MCYLPIPVLDHIYMEKSVNLGQIIHRNMELETWKVHEFRYWRHGGTLECFKGNFNNDPKQPI